LAPAPGSAKVRSEKNPEDLEPKLLGSAHQAGTVKRNPVERCPAVEVLGVGELVFMRASFSYDYTRLSQ